MSMEKFKAFKADMRLAISEVMKEHVKMHGVPGMGADCLWTMTVRRISRSINAPVGTNAAWVARQVFNETISDRPFKRFIID